MSTVEAEAVWAFAEHEHRDLVRGIHRIHDVACSIGRVPASATSAGILAVLGWITATLGPHMAWEETSLYPRIDALTGSPWATRAARFDHRQIRETAARIGEDRPVRGTSWSLDRDAAARCELFGLEALLRSHLEREERLLLPLLGEGPPVGGSTGAIGVADRAE